MLQAEAVEEARLDRALVLDRRAHVRELAVDLLVVVRLVERDAARAREREPRLVVAPARRQPARRLRHREDADAEDERPEDADAHDGAPRARVGDVARADGDAVRDEDAEGDEELVCRRERATDLWWRRLSLVLTKGVRT